MAYRFKARSAVPGAKALIQAAIAVVADYPAEADVRDGVGFGNDSLEGTYDPMAAAVFPEQENVSTVEPEYGPTGAEYAGALDLALYALIANIVDAEFVVVGHDNYAGGDPGEYPTTATSQAAQLAADVAAVEAEKANVLDDATILGVAGTFDLDANDAAVAAAQLATDIAAVDAEKANILDTATILTVTGTYAGVGAVSMLLEDVDMRLEDTP